MNKLYDYVIGHVEKTTCQCGRCECESKGNEELKDSVNLTFFKVKTINEPTYEEFKKLIEDSFPHWLDGQEHSYIEVGADVNDQGIGLMIIGLGHLLGFWQALSPDTMMPTMPDDLKMNLAEQGFVALKYNPSIFSIDQDNNVNIKGSLNVKES